MNIGFDEESSPPGHTGLEIAGWSPVESEWPPTLDSWRPASHQPSCGGGLRDVDGMPISLFCQVEQVAEDIGATVLASRMHQRGQVVGGGLDSLFVCFSDHQVISVRPHLLRVLHTDPDGD